MTSKSFARELVVLFSQGVAPFDEFANDVGHLLLRFGPRKDQP